MNTDQFVKKSSVSFTRKIIDCHAHFGDWFDGIWNKKVVLSPESLSKSIDIAPSNDINGNPNVVENVLISHIEGIDTKEHKPGNEVVKKENDANREIIELCGMSDRFLPIAVCQPGRGGDPAQLNNLIEANKDSNKAFRALKFAPNMLGIPSDDQCYDPYLFVADNQKLPCVFHTCIDGYSDPDKTYTLAKRHKEVPVVLYHTEMNGDYNKGISVVEESIKNHDANLYLEVSWVPEKAIIEAIKRVGSERVLFGTDTPLGEFGEVKGHYANRITSIEKAIYESFSNEGMPKKDIEDIIDNIFYNNSKRLFNL
jgi:hypothetical protein